MTGHDVRTDAPRPRIRRGLSLVELVLALAMTTLVASGVTGMLAGLGGGIAAGRDARTAMLATSASQRRLMENLADHAGVLDATTDRAVVWIGDTRPGGTVEASELAWISHRADEGTLVCERLATPETWSTYELAHADRRLGPTDDPWDLVAELRGRGLVVRQVLVDGLAEATLVGVEDGAGLRVDVRFRLDAAPAEASIVVPLRGRLPEGWS